MNKHDANYWLNMDFTETLLYFREKKEKNMQEQQIIKKSIFKQEIREYEYIPKLDTEYSHNWVPITFACRLSSKLVKTEEKIIATIDIPHPLLSVRDEFYFEELNKIVKIMSVIRTSENNVLYVVEPENVNLNLEDKDLTLSMFKEYMDKDFVPLTRVNKLPNFIRKLYGL